MDKVDEVKDQVGSAIDGAVQQGEKKLDQFRHDMVDFGEQHGGVVGGTLAKMAADSIGVTEGLGLAIYDMGKGVVQLADGVSKVASPLEWAVHRDRNLQRVEAAAAAGTALSKLGEGASAVAKVGEGVNAVAKVGEGTSAVVKVAEGVNATTKVAEAANATSRVADGASATSKLGDAVTASKGAAQSSEASAAAAKGIQIPTPTGKGASGLVEGPRVPGGHVPGLSIQAGGQGIHHPVVQAVYDSVPPSARSFYHGKCVEADALSELAKAGGARSIDELKALAQQAYSTVYNSKGTYLPPCQSCKQVLEILGIGARK